MNDKHAWWAWAVKNSICIICWMVLAVFFGRWWIALFAVFFMSTLTTKENANNHRRYVCDCCGRYSPEGDSLDEAEQRRIEAGWVRRKIDGTWQDICPECQKNLLRKDLERENERHDNANQ